MHTVNVHKNGQQFSKVISLIYIATKQHMTLAFCLIGFCHSKQDDLPQFRESKLLIKTGQETMLANGPLQSEILAFSPLHEFCYVSPKISKVYNG